MDFFFSKKIDDQLKLALEHIDRWMRMTVCHVNMSAKQSNTRYQKGNFVIVWKNQGSLAEKKCE